MKEERSGGQNMIGNQSRTASYHFDSSGEFHVALVFSFILMMINDSYDIVGVEVKRRRELIAIDENEGKRRNKRRISGRRRFRQFIHKYQLIHVDVMFLRQMNTITTQQEISLTNINQGENEGRRSGRIEGSRKGSEKSRRRMGMKEMSENNGREDGIRISPFISRNEYSGRRRRRTRIRREIVTERGMTTMKIIVKRKNRRGESTSTSSSSSRGGHRNRNRGRRTTNKKRGEEESTNELFY